MVCRPAILLYAPRRGSILCTMLMYGRPIALPLYLRRTNNPSNLCAGIFELLRRVESARSYRTIKKSLWYVWGFGCTHNFESFEIHRGMLTLLAKTILTTTLALTMTKTMDKVTIRQASKADYPRVLVMVRDAFWNLYGKGCDEHYLVHRMQSHADFLPELALVAVQEDDDDKTVLGYIAGIRSMIGTTECVTLAPLAVSRSCQGKGIGARLVEAFVAKCKSSSASYPCIALQGYPSYYARFGFENAQKFRIHMADKSQPLGLQILPIVVADSSQQVPRGDYVESSVFHELDPEAIEAFEAERAFPYKEKKEGTKSQQMFEIMIALAHDDVVPPEFDPKACTDTS
jgi:predicted N-acetyltransferase YhbS